MSSVSTFTCEKSVYVNIEKKITRYSIQFRDIYVKKCWFLSFALNIVKIISKTVSGKCSQSVLHQAKKFATKALKTASKWVFKKQ